MPGTMRKTLLMLALLACAGGPAHGQDRCADLGGDTDGDGVCDFEDNCPKYANPQQQDWDEDGVGDVCEISTDGDDVPYDEDNCPDLPNPEQADRDGDGIGDVCDDSDGDGVSDARDICPGVADPEQADRDGDGQGDACDDSDGDGVLDDVDVCPDVEDPDQTDSDGDGVGDACAPGVGDAGPMGDAGLDDGEPADAGPDARPDAADDCPAPCEADADSASGCAVVRVGGGADTPAWPWALAALAALGIRRRDLRRSRVSKPRDAFH